MKIEFLKDADNYVKHFSDENLKCDGEHAYISGVVNALEQVAIIYKNLKSSYDNGDNDMVEYYIDELRILLDIPNK